MILTHRLICLTLLGLVWLLRFSVQAASLLFLSAPPTQAGKFQRLAPLAEAAGFRMEYHLLNTDTAPLTAADLNAHDFIIIDAPYGAALGVAKTRVAPLLPGVTKPWAWMQTKQVESGNTDPAFAQQLHRYYGQGGRENFTGFFCQLRHAFGQAEPACAEPRIFPEAGIYHPDYPGKLFASLPEYLAWKQAVPAQQPTIGILFHQAYFAAELTGFLDDTIRRIEAGGGLAIALYAPAMTQGDITRLTTMAGKNQMDVLINTQIVLNAEVRKQEFAALGVPVIQAMPYRKGEETDWRQDQIGVAPMDIPFYLAQPEYAGISDPLIAAYTRKSDGDIVAISDQLDSVLRKAFNLAQLKRLPNAAKKTAVLFWNYPPGEKNLGASFLNVPRSLEQTLQALKTAGHTVEPRDAAALTESLSALLAPSYHDGQHADLLARQLADTLPVSRYRAWFDALPDAVRAPIITRFGEPEASGQVIQTANGPAFVIPRLLLGNIAILPQPPRGERRDDREKALYHNTKAPPSHFYLAVYLWTRTQFGAHALVHFGTHGTQEWQPGKVRGLAITDAPYLTLGDLPVFYPYIVDNIGEALQTKRRGRAVTISHQTPAFAPAGLHGQLVPLHDLLHTWLNMEEGAVKAQTARDLYTQAHALKLDLDLGLDEAVIFKDFRAFADVLHIHLHDLALINQPLGLATLGTPHESDLRLFTVMQMLGKPLLTAFMPEDPEELVVTDYQKLKQSQVWEFLHRHVRQNEAYAGSNAALGKLLAQARDYWGKLSGNAELASLVAGLEGRFIPTSYGGDPVKNPDALPTGRNLYGFDPSRVPTQQAWAAGQVAAQKLLEQHHAQHGAYPSKLAFSLWSVETMRHFGILEAQALALMGFAPVWDEGGRVTGIQAIPASTLKRPRVDVLISATGLYRDHFPNLMKWLAQAAEQAAQLDEADNAIAIHSRDLETALLAQGMPAEDARRLARTRVFSSESGAYGTGLEDATLASDTWGTNAQGQEDQKTGDAKLANLYLARMQFAYGPDESKWGERPAVNVYAEQLKGVQGALLSRTSNLYGMLTTDDPFQYLGGLGLAVRHLSGKTPALYISNLRDSDNPRAETAAGFLAKELTSRYYHPGWIQEMQKQGYSGALEILDTVNNLWGWEATAPETVRDDQWAEFKAVYVDDKLKLGIKEWFEQQHPHAQAQIVERMLEAIRKGYWQADAQTTAELAQRWQELAERYHVQSENAKFTAYVAQAAGFGLNLAAPVPQAAAQPEAQPAASPETPPQAVTGQKLERQEAAATTPQAWAWPMLLALGLLVLSLLTGAWQRARTTEPTALPI